jgi:hypothetical protein
MVCDAEAELGGIRHDVTDWVLGVRGFGVVVIEASVVAGYVIAWAARKARRVGGRLDVEADVVIDGGLDRLHEVVEAKLAGHPVMAELVEEAAAGGEVSDLTHQQIELAVAAAARKDEAFGQSVAELVAQLRQAEHAAGETVMASEGSAVFTGDAHAQAEGGGIAFGQVAGDVHLVRDRAGPPGPGRSCH